MDVALMICADGIFAVQRHLADLIRRGTMQTSGVAA